MIWDFTRRAFGTRLHPRPRRAAFAPLRVPWLVFTANFAQAPGTLIIMFTKNILFRAGLALAPALLLSSAPALRAQNPNDLNVDVANMRQEIDLLRQRVGQLEVNVDALQRQNNDLRASASDTANQNYATVAQLNKAIADLNRAIKDSKTDTLARVQTEMDSLAKKSNAALDSMAAKVNAARRTNTTSASGGGYM